MSSTHRFLLKIAGALVAVAALLPLQAMAQTPIQFRVQNLFPAGDPLYENFAEYARNVKAMSNGRIEIVNLSSGSVVGPAGTLDAVSAGVIDGHFSYAGYWSGREAGLAAMADLSGAYDDEFALISYYYGHGGLELLREMYAKYNMFTVGISTGGIESLPSRKRIETVADLRGMKVRLPPGIAALIFQGLGATPINLPLSEAFGALEKGVVDAADAGALYYNDKIGLHEHAKFLLTPSPHSTVVLDFTVNAEKWKRLPPDLQQIMLSAMPQSAMKSATQRIQADAKVKATAQSRGLTLTELSPAERTKFRAEAQKVWSEWAKRSEFSRRAVETQVEWLKLTGALK